MKIELKIVDFLARNIDKKFTINELSKAIKEYYSFVHRTVSKLVKDGVISKAKAGKAYLCTLNLENEKTFALIQLGEIEKRNEFYERNKEVKLILEDFVKSVETHPSVLSIILFGSYSKGNAAKESDIDVLILSKSSINIEKTTKEMYAKYGKEINPILMTTSDFKKQKDKAIIKEIINSHHVLHGVENFAGLVFRK
ncbi:MAG: nucleotidyltransferase domain-containing protein [Candidatus Aenigmarchaeota archaeon]|nr:nucleotidyltransferase domain-containing protein [Candidatus Aenigmarchaeota archaeon]